MHRGQLKYKFAITVTEVVNCQFGLKYHWFVCFYHKNVGCKSEQRQNKVGKVVKLVMLLMNFRVVTGQFRRNSYWL